MTVALPAITRPRWSGLDRDFQKTLESEGLTPEGKELRRKAEARFLYAEGKPFLLGPAQMVSAEWSEVLRRFARVYHRAIEAIVEASVSDETVRATLSTPPSLIGDLAADLDPLNSKIHICRLDLLLDPEGSFWVVETNANCPGGFIFSGICNRAWREFMEARGYPMPPALEHEEKGFMAKWFLAAMEHDTGKRPGFLALIREEGGNRLELTDFRNHVQWEGIDCEEVDPREIEYCGRGTPAARGRPIRYAYQKLGTQCFLRLRAEIDPFVRAVRDRALVVQNGQRGRWVGDNKLCLAIISDPAFRYLFSPEDWDLLQQHVPWSRNARLLDTERLESIRRERERYVLKRGLDTRGRGVVVGRGVDEDEWERAVKTAITDGWLVQEFHRTCWVARDFGNSAFQRHDLCLGTINGRLVTLFARSSGELRVNMALTGRMHPVFLAG